MTATSAQAGCTPGPFKIAEKNWLLHPCHWKAPIVATVDGKTTLVAETDEKYAALIVRAVNHDAQFDTCMAVLFDVPGETLLERVERLAAWYKRIAAEYNAISGGTAP